MTISEKELQAIYTKIENHTDENEHGDAVLVLAKFSGDAFAVKYAQAAIKTQEILGHASEEVFSLRKQATSMARQAIIAKHGEIVMDMLEGAF